jgi:hypothetical protein
MNNAWRRYTLSKIVTLTHRPRAPWRFERSPGPTKLRLISPRNTVWNYKTRFIQRASNRKAIA